MPNAIFKGNVGKNIEMRFSGDGTPVTNFSIASRADNDREKKQRTTWINLTCWGKRAEIVNELIHTGNHIQVKGNAPWVRFHRDENGKLIIGENGEPGYSLEMVAYDVCQVPEEESYQSIFEGRLQEEDRPDGHKKEKISK